MIRVKNIILPYEALSNFDLIEASKDLKIKCFRGVYLLDTMPGKPNNKECGIVNLDKNGGPGTHWVAWYKNGNNKIYFDSYGIQPSKEIIKYLGKGIEYNTDQLQPRWGGILWASVFICIKRIKRRGRFSNCNK